MISSPWGHDRTWERSVVERIRAGGPAPAVASVYDVPQAYLSTDGIYAEGWEHAEEYAKDAIRTGAAYLNDEAIAARALQRKLFREGVREAQAKAKARKDKENASRREKRRAEDEERREWLKRSEKRDKRIQKERDDWNHQAEERRILASKWICTICKGKSVIERKNDGYQITCMSCGKTAWGSHESLMKVLNP